MRQRVIISAAALASMLVVRTAVASYEFHIAVKGKKQGQFAGENARERHRDQIEVLSFQLAIQSPRDVATGQASGKRQFKPITVVKEWGAFAPDQGWLDVNCSALRLEAVVGPGRVVQAVREAAVQPGDCRFLVPLPNAGPFQVQVRAMVPGLGDGVAFQPMVFSGAIGNGQTLGGEIDLQPQGHGALLSLRWTGPAPLRSR